MNKYLFMLLVLLCGCKVHKDIQLKRTKTNVHFSADSNYYNQFDDSLYQYRSYTLDFDSNGMPKQARINEVVKRSKKSISKGEVKKDGRVEQRTKVESKKVERVQGSIPTSLIVFAVVVVIGILLSFLVRKQCRRLRRL